MKDIVLFGIQGSGKGTQASLLLQHYTDTFSYFSSGDLFRALSTRENAIGKYVKSRIAQGELIDDRVTNHLFSAYFYTVLDEKKNMLLDGYPRSIAQLDSIFALLDKENRSALAIRYQVDDEVVQERMMSRGRDDDTPQAIQKRIQGFYDQTMPVIKHFEQHADLVVVNADDSIANIHQKTIEAIDEHI